MKKIIALIVLLFTATSAGAAEWVRVTTPNFVVFGEVGEKRTIEIAEAFERFREAMAQVFPNATASPVPTTVVVFESQRSFAPYRPRHNGKPVSVGGYFVGSESSNMIALTVEDRAVALRTVFHEYTHLVAANAARSLPAWADEGLAEFYSTFAVAEDGKGGLLGRAIRSHYALLGRSALLPLEQLLTVDHTSDLYNEGQRRSIFYAQSWAMVHILLAGQPNRSKEFGQYIRLTTDGTASVDAWRQAFGSFDAISEVKRFLRNRIVLGLSYSFDERIGPVTAQMSRPKPSDVSAVLAALLQNAAPDEMELRLRQAVEMTPSSALARSLLGVVKAEANQSAAATALLFEAAADKSDWLVQYYAAQGLTRLARSSGKQRDPKVVAEAQAAVEAVLAARPQLAHALALKAYLQNDRDGAAAAARARALAPGREDYIYLEARLRAEAGEFAAARKLLAVLLRPGFPPNVRDSARRLMEQIVEVEDARAGRVIGSMTPPVEPAPPAVPADQPIAILRVLKPGEQRTEGALEKIDCSPDGRVIFVVRSGGELRRFEAGALGEIEFIRYGGVRPEPIQCSDRTPPDHVYVTWVPMNAPGATGRAVAMEFMSRK